MYVGTSQEKYFFVQYGFYWYITELVMWTASTSHVPQSPDKLPKHSSTTGKVNKNLFYSPEIPMWPFGPKAHKIVQHVCVWRVTLWRGIEALLHIRM